MDSTYSTQTQIAGQSKPQQTIQKKAAASRPEPYNQTDHSAPEKFIEVKASLSSLVNKNI